LLDKASRRRKKKRDRTQGRLDEESKGESYPLLRSPIRDEGGRKEKGRSVVGHGESTIAGTSVETVVLSPAQAPVATVGREKGEGGRKGTTACNGSPRTIATSPTRGRVAP